MVVYELSIAALKKLPQNVRNLKRQTVSHEGSTGQESGSSLTEWFWLKVSRGVNRVKNVT